MTQQKRKGQAALEFLANYGWVIIIILIMIGAFIYFDVLTPSKLIPGNCEVSGLNCEEYKVVEEGIQFNVKNNQGQTFLIQNAKIKDNLGNEINCETNNNNLVTGTNTLITCKPHTSYTQGERIRAEIIISYVTPGGSIEQTTIGKINAPVNEGTLDDPQGNEDNGEQEPGFVLLKTELPTLNPRSYTYEYDLRNVFENCEECNINIIEVKQKHRNGAWEIRLDTSNINRPHLPYGLSYKNNMLYHPEQAKAYPSLTCARGPNEFTIEIFVNNGQSSSNEILTLRTTC